MGGVISYLLSFFAPSRQADSSPDPTTGLTQKDRSAITQTWSVIGDKDSVKSNAVEFFMQLFAAYPYLMDYFSVFKGKTLTELRNSPKLRAHATSVFYTITSYVETVDDPETLVGLVQKIAESHIGRGITVKEFENLKTVFLKFLKSQLGPKCTPQIESAWNKLLTAQNSVFQSTADELLGKKSSINGLHLICLVRGSRPELRHKAVKFMCAISDVTFAHRYAVLTMGNICAEKAPPEDLTPDPETALNQKERRLLKELWLTLTEHATLKEEGVKFSNKLFTKYPTMIEYYPEFVGKGLRDTGKSIALRAHGIAVMFGMTAYIECMDDPGAIVSLIQRMAMSHRIYGVTAVEMEKLLDVLYEFVRDECGEALDKESLIALKKLLNFHHKVYEQTFDYKVPDDCSLNS